MKQSRNYTPTNSQHYRLKKYTSTEKKINILIITDNDILYFVLWYLI